MHKGGKLRVLATSDAQRSKFLPDIPTFRKSGFDLQATGWYGMFAPAKTPPDVIERLNKAIVNAIKSPDVSERMLDLCDRADRHLGRRAWRDHETRRRLLGAGGESVGVHAGQIAAPSAIFAGSLLTETRAMPSISAVTRTICEFELDSDQAQAGELRVGLDAVALLAEIRQRLVDALARIGERGPQIEHGIARRARSATTGRPLWPRRPAGRRLRPTRSRARCRRVAASAGPDRVRACQKYGSLPRCRSRTSSCAPAPSPASKRSPDRRRRPRRRAAR